MKQHTSILLLFCCVIFSLKSAFCQPKYFMTSDSVKIGYIEFGSKNNIPLIFVHGGPGSNSKDFIHIAESIKTKFHVFLYDQRGCGLSERNIENKKISFNKMISDLKEFQEHLRIENAAILGHSFGGAIAQEYCILNFSKVKYLIIIDGIMDAKLSWKERIEDIEKFAIQKQNKEQLALIRKFKLGKKLDSNEKVFLLQEQKPYWYEIKNKSDAYDLNWLLKYGYNAENIDESFLVAKSFMESGFIDNYCLKNNIKINTKSLFIYGKYDKITSKNQFAKVKNQFPNNTLIVIDSCGHFPHIERKSKLIKILTENIN